MHCTLLLAALILAQPDPDVIAPKSVPRDTQVIVTVSDDCDHASIRVIGQRSFAVMPVFGPLQRDGQFQWAWVGPPDRYLVMVDCWSELGVRSYTQTTTIEGGDPDPDPGPGPGPDPDPDPTPPGSRRIVILEESSSRTPELSNLWIALRVNDEIRKYKPLILDVDTELGAVQHLVARAGEGSLPAFFVTDDDFRIVYQGEVPSTPEAMIEVVQENGG